ncbi:head GIN domain-containing protein [Ferruginibacter paludis]|uniref:head GIN domain-containing protein n=1 Tax=Ferruginibacter paludis TaxID=1310417 RepID=UPI0025B49FF1|nr:head GIN domain-containing protein [Ferruginibacter paludis]MDN3655683.1 head GIN domain-containing protein [Ferruginibacter paludis]
MKQFGLLALTILILSACTQIHGSGNIVTETRNTGDFTGIEAGGAYEVELKNGSPTEVKVEADDNLIKDIETTVSGHTLHIRTRDGINFNNGHYKVYIIAPEITNIHSSGAADVAIKNVLKTTDKLQLEASGAANINGEIDAPEVSAEATGASTIKVSGRTKEYHSEASGSGTIKTEDLMSETTTATASGAASIHVYASIQLTADASGAANIYYKGAASVSQKTSGAANVKKED